MTEAQRAGRGRAANVADADERTVGAVAEPAAAEGPAESLEATLAERTAEHAPDEVAAAEAPAAAVSDAEWEGVRDYAKKLGVELPYRDDAAALSGLLDAYRSAQRRDYYADLGRRLAPHTEDFERYLAEQSKPAAPGPAPWEPPPFQKVWASMVERDPDTGAIRAKAGYDPAIADKVTAYVEWRERFLESPHEVMAPLVESRAKQLIREEMQAYRQRAVADQIVAQNAAWLFQHHEDGRPVTTAEGQRQLTPEGVLYTQTVQALSQAGVTDVELAAGLARTVVEHAALRQAQAAPAGVRTGPNGAAAPAAPAAAERAPSGGGKAKGGGGAAQGSSRGLGLREMLERKLKDYPDRE